MKRGSWHQCGDKSQRLVLEQLQYGSGVGVIVSPRDLPHHLADDYAAQYRQHGADVLVDQQFYVPDFTNDNLSSYPIAEHRIRVSELREIGSADLSGVSRHLETINRQLATTGLVAPALVYEAGRPDIIDVNANLFVAAKAAGDAIGIPTYATAFIGQSVTSSASVTIDIISAATSLNADGWYYAFEYPPERIPSSEEYVYRCIDAGLTLACTGKPVLHAYAGPMAILSFGFGATGAATGHSQNLWQFTRGRWQPGGGQGGGGDAPPRFFSKALWGTIIFPDETTRLSPALRMNVLARQSPFSAPTLAAPPWSRWDANKHLLYVICAEAHRLSEETDPRQSAASAVELLDQALNIHGQISQQGILLRDGTTAYQANWRAAVQNLLASRADDYDYLDLLL